MLFFFQRNFSRRKPWQTLAGEVGWGGGGGECHCKREKVMRISERRREKAGKLS